MVLILSDNRIRLFIITMMLVCFYNITVYGTEGEDVFDINSIISEQTQEIEFDKIQDIIEQSNEISDFNLQDFFIQYLKNPSDLKTKGLLSKSVQALIKDIKEFSSYMLKVIIITIMAAVFKNIASTSPHKEVVAVANIAMLGGIITYILSSYSIINEIAYEVVGRFDQYITSLVPSMMAVSLMSGSPVSGNLFTQTILMVSGLINKFIQVMLLPFLYTTLIFVLVNAISGYNGFKLMIELLKKTYYIVLKIVIWGFLGFYSLQSIGLTSAETLVSKTTKQTIAVLPVVGMTLSEVSEIVMVCGNTTKNIFGIGILIAGLLIVLYPVLKILCFALMYKLLAAVIEPIASKGITTCLTDVGDVSFMLLSAILFVTFLFIITTSLSLFMSNMKNFMM